MSGSLAALYTALLVSLICAGCTSPVKESKGFDREFNREALMEALTKVDSRTSKVVVGQHNRKQVERVLGKPELVDKVTEQERKLTRYTYRWTLAQTRYGSGPNFMEVEDSHVLELTFDAGGMLIRKGSHSSSIGMMRYHR